MPLIAAEGMPLLSVFLWMLWFFLFVMWIWLLISIFGDIFRSDMSGWFKALWVVFVIVLPLLGVLIYLIANGGKMQERTVKEAAAIQQAQEDYIRNVAGASTADEIEKLSKLHDDGKLTDDEFAAQKAKLLG
ncbi:MAG: SHOCT domain-containing protein [Actinomycetota bacterium]